MLGMAGALGLAAMRVSAVDASLSDIDARFMPK